MSYATTIAGLCGLSVAGVKRAIAYMPAQVSTADLPLLFPSLPRGETQIVTLTGGMDLPTLRVTLVILVEPTAQNRPQPTWDACIALLDAQAAALDAATLTQGVVGYSIRLDQISLSGVDAATTYWAIIAEVEVQ